MKKINMKKDLKNIFYNKKVIEAKPPSIAGEKFYFAFEVELLELNSGIIGNLTNLAKTHDMVLSWAYNRGKLRFAFI